MPEMHTKPKVVQRNGYKFFTVCPLLHNDNQCRPSLFLNLDEPRDSERGAEHARVPCNRGTTSHQICTRYTGNVHQTARKRKALLMAPEFPRPFFDKLREERKRGTGEEELNLNGETYTEFMARECKELHATIEFQEFREFCNQVKTVRLHADVQDPEEVAKLDRFLHSNPCVGDLPLYDDDYIEYLYWRRERYPEWKEELADYRDIIAENTEEELDRLQLEARAKLPSRNIILARGGF
ncbi:hypothetical protein B0H13DRAFT_2353931 [Mycena leptocephala]|nr:hypothetical protein B0H13DRAFT_2353931 [Mycena leptocephala]